MKREERELLEAQSIPLRNYLMTYVMPTLMQGLNECCKVRPDDPVDFLVRDLSVFFFLKYQFENKIYPNINEKPIETEKLCIWLFWK